ncbi:MAG TPA: hypothetical protein VES42_04300, partial [Pilimelia sp.]|nr:hypothetical protein [Pilimelia sp.]
DDGPAAGGEGGAAGGVWDDAAAAALRARWQAAAAQFVEEPGAGVAQARELVAEAVRTLAERLLAEEAALVPDPPTGQPDTEAMRLAMRRYREVLDRVLAV